MISLESLTVPTCLRLRRTLLVLALVSVGASSPASALDIWGGIDGDGCECPLPEGSSVEGCFEISSSFIRYDILVTGLTNADITLGEVERAAPAHSCTAPDPAVPLFALEKFGPDTGPARFRGTYVLSAASARGGCPADPADCIVQGEGLVRVVLDTAEACKQKIIKDACSIAVPTASEWGIVVMAGLVMVIGTVLIRRV